MSRHSAPTTSSSRATDGRAASSSSPLRDPRRQLVPEPIPEPQHPRHVRDVGEEAQPDRQRLRAGRRARSARRAGTRSSRRRAASSKRKTASRARGPRRRVGGQQRAAPGYRSSRYSMITADSGRTKPSSRIGTLAARVQVVDPRRPVAQVDLDRLVVEALLGEDDPDAGAVRARGRVVQLHGSSPIIWRDRLVQLVGRRQVGAETRPCASRRRTSSRSAPVRRATSVGFASSASSSPFEQLAVVGRHRQVLVDHASALVHAEAHDRAVLERERDTTAPSRSRELAREARTAPRGRRRRAGRRSGSSRSPRPRRVGAASRGTNWPTARWTDVSSSVCTCTAPRDAPI